MLTNEELNHDQDYINLIKAVINNAIVDYCKLQHPKNRNKKYLEEGFLSSIAMFFDEDYKFEAFTSLLDDNSSLSTKELLSILLKSKKVNMEKTKKHVINNSINYWWEKNFNDLPLLNKITIAGKVFSLYNLTNDCFVDYNKNCIYLPVKKTGSDRIFFKFCLEIILKECNIILTETEFNTLYKIFYLFLKVNHAFKE